MTWKKFITLIRHSGISGEASYKILLDLFEKAGCKCDVSDATAKSWLNESRNCKASTYFPAGKVDTNSLFRYFRNRPGGKLKQLQQIFQTGEHFDLDSPIDVETNDIDIFCWSLVNQFLDLLAFQRVDMPHSDTRSETTFAETDQQLNHSETDIPKDTSSDREQSTTQQLDGATPISLTNIPKEGEHSIRAAFFPHSDDCCYHCSYWDGNRKTFGAYTTATYGYCLKHNRIKQLSSDEACEDYEKREKQSGEW